jgi:proteasome lid subunit RPN8/RPN11
VNTISRIAKNVLAKVWEHAQQEPGRECCGLLGGRDGQITRSFRATNAAADTAKNYEISPEELFRLMREMRSAGFELMGIYHSHPTGNNEPSPRDIERAYYPDAAYFILSPQVNSAPVRAFSIRDGCVVELRIEVE